MVRRKVLLVEDHEDICKLMECALNGEFELLTTRDGKSALKLVQEQSPIVILLDLSLPPNPASPEEGLRLLRELQRYGSQSKVIVTTGFHDRQLAIMAISLGAYDFLTKPVDLNLLRLLVRRASWIAALEQEWQISHQRRQEFQIMSKTIGNTMTTAKSSETIKSIRRIFPFPG